MRILSIYNLNQVARTYQEDLMRLGHSVDIFEPSLAGAAAARPVKLAMMTTRLLNLRQVTGQLRPEFYDLAHIHWASYGILGLASRIPFLVECHGSDVRYRLQNPAHRSLLKAIFRRAASVHCITPDLLSAVQSVRPDALFFPGPVDTERFTPLEERDHDDQTRPWRILLFMRLDPIKGAEKAVEGIMRFVKRHPAAHVQLLDWGQLKEKFKKRYGECFEFLPRVSSLEVPAMLRAADVVVGQCEVGCFGFCELQAMSCAKPVITSFVYPDAYSTPPPICQARNPEEIEAQLEKLFQDRAMARDLGLRARAWIINNHDRRQLASRLEKCYRSILA